MYENCHDKNKISKELQIEAFNLKDKYRKKLAASGCDAYHYFAIMQDLAVSDLVSLIEPIRVEYVDDLLKNVCQYAKEGLKKNIKGIDYQEITIEKGDIKLRKQTETNEIDMEGKTGVELRLKVSEKMQVTLHEMINQYKETGLKSGLSFEEYCQVLEEVTASIFASLIRCAKPEHRDHLYKKIVTNTKIAIKKLGDAQGFNRICIEPSDKIEKDTQNIGIKNGH